MKTTILVTITILLSACCAFVPCDRFVHVAGYVFDENKNPIQNANVEFYGVTEKTDKNGCFYFGGVLAAPGFNVSVSKTGYKPYKEGKEFKYYEIAVILEKDNSNKNSTGNWREVEVTKPGNTNPCIVK